MESKDYQKIRYHFDVQGGDWDKGTLPLERNFVYKSLEARFVHQMPWRSTPIYAVAAKGIEDGTGRYHGCRDTHALERRLHRLDSLFQRIKRDGYLAQTDLVSRNDVPLRKSRQRPPELDEVVVNIDRNGGLILVDGVHRFSIAKILGIKEIPVLVLVRHSLWQEQRDLMHRKFVQAGPIHPDFLP